MCHRWLVILPMAALAGCAAPRGGLPPEPNTGREVWYRFDLPPGAARVRLAEGAKPLRLYVDGQEVPLTGASAQLRSVATERPLRRAALVVQGPQPLQPPITVDADPTQILVGDWATQGLAGYVGEATYERTIGLPSEYAGQHLFLDLGQVGVAARVEIDGKPAGTRAYPPYVFDLGQSLKPGPNRLRIAVANTLASAAKGAQVPAGILGPVRMVAYREVEVVVR
jgi:hypothetical protein